jgi:hypothetical protein
VSAFFVHDRQAVRRGGRSRRSPLPGPPRPGPHVGQSIGSSRRLLPSESVTVAVIVTRTLPLRDWGGSEAVSQRIAGRSDAIRDADFAVDVGQVPLDGAGGKGQTGRDVSV